MDQPTPPHRNGPGAPEAGRQAPTLGRGARPVPLDRLCAAGPAAALDFETTAEVAPMDGAPGQDRAEEALRFALAMPHEGYNAFVLGSPGAGRRHLVRRVLAEIAPTRPTPPDQVTLQNFEDSRRPLALQLAAGRAVALKADLDQLVNELVTVVPAALSGDPLQAQRATLEASLEDRQDAALAPVRSLAESLDIAVLRSPEGFVLAPRSDEAVLSAEEVAALPSDTRRTVEQAAIKVREAMARALGPAEEWVREHRQALTALDQAAARAAAAPPVSALKAQWAESPRLCTWLDALLEDVVQNAERLSQEDEDESPAALLLGEDAQDPVQAWTRRYRAHILVDHANTVGAPIVWEEDPTLSNLSGRVEHRTRLGTLVTDASLIRPGALHRANGGYLVLDARRVLSRPMAWEYLEQALRSRRVQIRALSESLGLVATESLDPEPLALDLKVVLVGERELFYTLSDIDPEFTALFKVPVDFEDDVNRAPADELRFVRLVASLIQKDRLRPFHRDAVARCCGQAARPTTSGV